MSHLKSYTISYVILSSTFITSHKQSAFRLGAKRGEGFKKKKDSKYDYLL